MGVDMADKVFQRVKTVIAKECGVPSNLINSKTQFMSNTNFSYFECVGALYTLQHKFKVKLPESDYDKYKTVGSLTRCIIKQLKDNSNKR